ncbi:DUF362 domain-containing protein [Methanohalophilus sp. 2-GBenrich]|nr:DUF362 domain-containing protein [Methanohalophilus sp. 2-GBenrich]
MDYSTSKQAVREAIDLLGCFDEIKAGMRILIKPNVLTAREPEDAATTHPSLVRAVCEIVKEAGAHPVVGDCAGITSAGATAQALEKSGIKQAALEGGGEVVNFQTAGFSKVKPENPLRLDEIYVSDSVLDADYIINLPKLKTHELTTMTGAVKNMFGAVPLRIRKEAHMMADPLIFSEILLDIYNVATPQLSLIDAVVGMEGDGPSRGKLITNYKNFKVKRLIIFACFSIVTSISKETSTKKTDPNSKKSYIFISWQKNTEKNHCN